jgi:hypothetical protein
MGFNEKRTLFIEEYHIFVHIGKTTVHFSKARTGLMECPIYLDRNGRNPSIKYDQTHRKSLTVLIQELSDTSEFPQSFAVPIRRRKEQRHTGDRGANRTLYKTVSLHKMLTA